ncbi:MAG: acyloxyacyl hydrolase [Nitrospiraceae bacterium]|nr:acyloxyacyl hydrolase [Nitrospiraceae bacterium]
MNFATSKRGVSLLAMMFFVLVPPCSAAGQKRFEIDIAGGGSLNGNGAKQVMLMGAWQRPLYPDFLLRVEPTLEYINTDSDTLWTGGFSLVGRKLARYKSLTAFVDLGAGANLISNRHFAGRLLGDDFLFDLILGGGFYLARDISLSYRYRHLSNAGLFNYNEGIDSYYIILGIGI